MLKLKLTYSNSNLKAPTALPSEDGRGSATTRPKRNTEVHGKDYFFLSNETFDQYIKDDAFIEWCNVHHHRYGTLKKEYEKACQNKKLLIIEIDVQGANKIIQNFSTAISIFIEPPSIDELKERLIERNTESESSAEGSKKRTLEFASVEIAPPQEIKTSSSERESSAASSSSIGSPSAAAAAAAVRGHGHVARFGDYRDDSRRYFNRLAQERCA